MNEEELQKRRRDNEEAATRQRAAILGLEYRDLRDLENEMGLVRDVMTVERMRMDNIIPIQAGDEEVSYEFIVISQTPRSAMEKLRKEYADEGRNLKFILVSNSAFQTLMLRHDPPKQAKYDDIKISKQGDSETINSVSQTLNSVMAERVFDFLIDQADKLGASDMHIENMRSDIRIRLRVDGILHPVANLDKNRYRVIVGELASRAHLSTASTKPQSGHIQKEVFRNGSSHILNIRVEMVPTMYGQDAVMRFFNFDESLLNLDLLGITKQEKAVIDEVITHPRGMVLMVGPTGSGKSTTLYSILNALNTPDRKIITLEDPIEYGIAGISQIPVDTTKGDLFADGLRSILRLDPDVVMVGEIRDADTVKTAIQASITGHLVLSSFHADSSAAAFARMIDMIGTNPIFSSSVRLVIAQRLVRKLTSDSKPREATDTEKNFIRKVLYGVEKATLTDAGVEDLDLNNIILRDPVVSDEAPFGFSGRIALMEQMQVNDEIAKFIRGDVAQANAKDIEALAKQSGMLTLEQKGVIAAIRGETTIEEIARVL